MTTYAPRYAMREKKFLGKIEVRDGIEHLTRGGYYNPFTLVDICFKLRTDGTVSIRYGWGYDAEQSSTKKVELRFFENDPRCIYNTHEALEEAINTWEGRPRG